MGMGCCASCHLHLGGLGTPESYYMATKILLYPLRLSQIRSYATIREKKQNLRDLGFVVAKSQINKEQGQTKLLRRVFHCVMRFRMDLLANSLSEIFYVQLVLCITQII